MDLRKFDLKKFVKKKNKVLVLPTGEYKAVLKNSSTELSGNGEEVLKLVWLIKGGEYDGSHYYSYFNLSNECSLKVLFIMIRNMGINPDKIQNTDQLYGHECLLRVKLFQHPTYGPSNLILKYLPMSTLLHEEIPFDLIVSDFTWPTDWISLNIDQPKNTVYYWETETVRICSIVIAPVLN